MRVRVSVKVVEKTRKQNIIVAEREFALYGKTPFFQVYNINIVLYLICVFLM